MAKQPTKPSPAKLRKAFVADLTAVWQYAQQKYPNDQPYALALYGTEGGTAELYPEVLTEAGLTRVAHRYIDKKIYETIEEARKALRYSVADSPWFSDFADRLPTVKALCQPFADSMYEDDGYKLLAKAAVEAFKILDDRQLFGSGATRERILLVVIVEDTEVDYSLKSAKAANPLAVFDAYKKHNEPDGPFQSINSMAISADGNSLYACRTRANPKGKPGKNEFIREFVAYEVDGALLKQRWAFDLTAQNASAQAIAATGDTVIGLASRYDQDARRLLVFKLSARTGELLSQKMENGEPAALAVSADGAHIAVSTHGGDVLLFDAEFKLRHKIATKVKNSLLFLRTTGELLVGGQWSIAIVDPVAASIKETLDLPGFHLAANADETLIVASRWFDPAMPNEPFGLGVLSLPDFKLLKEIALPERQLVRAAISPDGRHVAAEAHAVEGFLHRGVILERETGHTVADQKMKPHAGAFFPDNCRAAFALTHSGHAAPVKILELPAP